MSGSTLDPSSFDTGGGVRVGRGHGTAALGPSDLSDTGSDVMGGPGLLDDDLLGLDRGTNEDSEAGHLGASAGASIGDLDGDADTDSGGTGEHIQAGKDPAGGVNHDIGFDRIVTAEEAGLGGGLDQAEEALARMSPRERAAIRAEEDEGLDADEDAIDADGPDQGGMLEDNALLDNPHDDTEVGDYGNDVADRT